MDPGKNITKVKPLSNVLVALTSRTSRLWQDPERRGGLGDCCARGDRSPETKHSQGLASGSAGLGHRLPFLDGEVAPKFPVV